MNIKVDTHSHTLVSGHAYNTIQEMAKMAKEHGMEAIAFTEHAPEMPGTCGIFYFENSAKRALRDQNAFWNRAQYYGQRGNSRYARWTFKTS